MDQLQIYKSCPCRIHRTSLRCYQEEMRAVICLIAKSKFDRGGVPKRGKFEHLVHNIAIFMNTSRVIACNGATRRHPIDQ